MELAVNNFVGIILGVAIFGGGAALLFNITDEARDLQGDISDQMEQQVLESFPADQKLFVPSSLVTYEDGSATVYYGLYNNANSPATFSIKPRVQGWSDYDVQVISPVELDAKERSTGVFRINSDNKWVNNKQETIILNVTAGGTQYASQVAFVEP